MLRPEELKEIIIDPQETIRELGKTLIGQDKAKRSLALLALNRQMLVLSKFGLIGAEDILIDKTNVLLIGPTGCGKTSIVNALSDVIDVPITTFDITSVTEAGYIGGKVEDILERHIKKHYEHYGQNSTIDFYEQRKKAGLTLQISDIRDANTDIMETGIIYIDEIDKIADRGDHHWKGKSTYVQNELLKFLEGQEVDVGKQGHSSFSMGGPAVSKLRTHDLFFILGGAFQGLDEIILKRLNKNSTIGFSSALPNRSDSNVLDNVLSLVTTEDLINYGFKPEFVGRIPVRATLSSMTEEMLCSIVCSAQDSPYFRYINFLKPFGISLYMEPAGVKLIAKHAIKLETGARALNNIFFQIFEDFLVDIFSYTDNKITITESLVRERMGDL